MNPAPLFKAFVAFRELLGAMLSFGVLLWLFTTGVVAAFLAVSGRLPEFAGFARDQFFPCMLLGAFTELGGRLIIWRLSQEIRTPGTKLKN